MSVLSHVRYVAFCSCCSVNLILPGLSVGAHVAVTGGEIPMAPLNQKRLLTYCRDFFFGTIRLICPRVPFFIFEACLLTDMRAGATKAFLSELAISLAAEVAVDGIDIMALHPSPVASAFYDSAHKLDALEMFRKTGKSPSVVTDAMLATVGRAVVCDQGYYSIGLRIVLKVRCVPLRFRLDGYGFICMAIIIA